MSRTFFSREQAELYADILKYNDGYKVEIWLGKDGFNQTTYTVKWDEE